MKCNPNHNVLSCVFENGFGADATSLGEVIKAYESGLPKERIYYSAPGKTFKDIEDSIEKSYIIVDSIEEIGRIQNVAENKGITAEICIRINPEYSFTDEQGYFSKFGVDQDYAFDFLSGDGYKNVKVNGLHVHLKSQELDTDVLIRHYTNILKLAEKFIAACGTLDYINLGSGIGVQYAPEDVPVDMQSLSSAVNSQLDKFREAHPETKIMMETGRYTVCKSGTYVTKVVDRKVSHGKTIILLKNTLNGFFKPSLAQLVTSYSPDEYPAVAEPLFTCKDAFEIVPLVDDEPSETVTIFGNLCTATDIVAADALMPYLKYGDIVTFTNAGSYAAVLSPMQFSSQEKPVELFLTAGGEVIL